ncbi:biotin--[acetyl-CoA-carboxylase] ligase, partial [Thioalkalivibrio sp. XN8]|nr:biotin--[acetyl-CoA-carboxylase] ligase [Thioalkalivibrio sp. XN8]
RAVRIEGAGPPLAGVARGIDATGALLLELPGGVVRRVTAGEASLRARP